MTNIKQIDGKNNPSNPILEAALRYGRAGLSIYPSPRKDGAAYVKWKTASTDDEDMIRQWWTQWPDALICLDCGKSEIGVVDADTLEGHGVDGISALVDLELNNENLPATRQAQTPSKGVHYFFLDKGARLKTTANRLGPGLDTRGRGGMVVLAPSVIKGKGAYRWLNKLKMATIPEWIIDLVGEPANVGPIPDAEFEPAYTDEEFKELLSLLDVNDFRDHDKWLSLMLACTHSSTVTDGKEAFMDWTTGKGEGEFAGDWDIINDRWDYNFGQNRNKGGKAYKVGTFNKFVTDAGFGDLTQNEAEITASEDFADLPREEEITFAPEKAARVQGKIETRKKNAANFGLDFVRGDDVVMRNIDWIWEGHLALGQHTAIAGVQGDGKSQLVYGIAAAVTTGGTWPGSTERAPIGNVILFNAEDTTEDVMTPRLKAAGADMTKIFIVKASLDKISGAKRKFSLQTDLERLTKLAEKIGDVRLITFDPVSSYLGGEIDSHNNTELRDALDPITEMAARTGAAVISVTHFNKSAKGVNALNRVMGGAAFTAAPRAAFAVIRDAKKPLTRMLLPLKNNLAAEGASYGLCFTLSVATVGTNEKDGKPIIAPFVVWGDKTTMTADEALNANSEKLRGPSKIEEATSFLIQILASEPMLARDVMAAADKRGIAPKTLVNARRDLGVISEKRFQRDGRGPWEWSLPDGAIPPTADGKIIKPAPYANPDDAPDFDYGDDALEEFADPEIEAMM